MQPASRGGHRVRRSGSSNHRSRAADRSPVSARNAIVLTKGSIRQTEELQRSFRLPLRLDQCAPCDWPITRWWTEPSTIGRPRQQIKGRDWKVGSKKSAIESGYQLSRTSPAKTARYLLDPIRRASRAICLVAPLRDDALRARACRRARSGPHKLTAAQAVAGDPPGERNGRYRHGERTKGAIAERQKFS